MLVYQSNKQGFLNDVISNNIENIILENFIIKLGRNTSASEIASWKNSMMYMNNILNDIQIPNDAGISIEYQIPQTSKRIDFIITGRNQDNSEHAILIELKQWSRANLTDKDAIVTTFLGRSEQEVNHPSYQAWSYAALLKGFNQTVYEEDIQLQPCAYLHNYASDDVIENDRYAEYIAKAPVFLKDDALKLREFVKRFIKYGDTSKIMYRIENGKIRPSKSLADNLASMLKGNQEFVMIDEQKIIYEAGISIAKKSGEQNKNVVIIEGGPGTGKSVVAVNLLVNLTKQGLVAQYVTKNAAPRTVYESKLTGTFRKTEISNMFSGSGAYIDCDINSFDTLIVDEAHRLNRKSGMFQNLGVNQIREIIAAAKCSVFFIDENQKVTFNDIGEKEEIINWASEARAKIHYYQLSSQFRCNGSDGYLAWLDDILQIKRTANSIFDPEDYDFQIVDDPNKLRNLIFEKNKINNKARLVAGYCWNWVSKKDKNAVDIQIPEYNFQMKWNLATDGNLWIVKPEAVSEAGCIHTVQGLEVDYIGVIVGLDLVVRNGLVCTNPSKRSKTDSSLKGFKTMLKEDPIGAQEKADKIIKNTYRTLMTRGMKGCYVYFVDEETREYFKERIQEKKKIFIN